MGPERAFKLTQRVYPGPYLDKTNPNRLTTWQLVDAFAASQESDSYYGKLVLAEYSGEDPYPTFHWKYTLLVTDIPRPNPFPTNE